MERTISWLLQFAIAFAFLYPPISALKEPDAWIGYFPAFVQSLPIPELVLLHVFGLMEFIIGVWLLSGKNIFYPALASALILTLIVIFNLSQMDVVFRDISLILAALALALQNAPGNKKTTTHDPTLGVPEASH